MSDEIVEWITVNGAHIPVKKGETKEAAIMDFLSDQDCEKADKLDFWYPKFMERIDDYKINRVLKKLEKGKFKSKNSDYLTQKERLELGKKLF